MSKSLFMKVFFPLLAIVVYGFLSTFSIMQMSDMMDMGTPTNHSCAYMTGAQGLCPMNLLDHVAVWRQFSMAHFPLLEMLLLSASVLFFFITYHISSKPSQTSYRLIGITDEILDPLYQSLFSNGTLHSKEY